MHTDLPTIKTILRRYGFPEAVTMTESFIDHRTPGKEIKAIFSVTLVDRRKLVIKIVHDHTTSAKQPIIEAQSRFSEAMRARGIRTPRRYMANGQFCTLLPRRDLEGKVTVEDYCGREILYITPHLSEEIGKLMARMHILSLKARLTIGCGTLFSAAYDNDVDAYDRFCVLCQNERIDQNLVSRIMALREEKLSRIRKAWTDLPRCAVQGDISVNNLVWDDNGLQVFDYNNAGDEVLVGDMVLEGLLTAFEMDLPDGVPETSRDGLFDDFLRGYLSIRPLNPQEQAVVWDIYTLWHGLWFTRIVYHEQSLEKVIGRGDWVAANGLLAEMVANMERTDDGRFLAQHP